MYQVVNRKNIRQGRKKHFWRRRTTNLSRPRLCVFRSPKHIQAQIIDDQTGLVLAAASSVEASLKSADLTGVKLAEQIGTELASRAISAGVKDVVFDRNGFAYHGRIAALANSARTAGLNF